VNVSNYWPRVETYWPARLLHIPTLTSIQREGNESYKGISRPKYGILTYTWGRWKTTGGDALPIKGTTWTIPSVEPEHFTVSEFLDVIERIRLERLEWAWIDIACINQNDTKSKMDEIGKQAGIFKTAYKTFVWLSRLPGETLQAEINKIWIHIDVRPEPGKDKQGNMEVLLSSINTINADPWFSSLWTLQEITLRKDAILLSKEGRTVRLDYVDGTQNVSMTMDLVINTFVNIHLDLAETIISQPKAKQTAKRIADNIERIGFNYGLISNPNVCYGVARFREAKHPLDRVYGIMQVYNIRVGESVRSYAKPPTLDGLMDEFAQELNRRSPLLGQSFLHIQKPAQGKSWRISQFSRVPDQLQSEKFLNPIFHSRIEMDALGNAIINGKILPFHTVWTIAVGTIFLDDYVENQLNMDQEPPQLFNSLGSRFASKKKYEKLIAAYGMSNLKIVLLGEKPKETGYHGMSFCLIIHDRGTYGERLGLFRFATDVEDGGTRQLAWESATIQVH
jgi:heterokaryon incompatibility protein (HET)